VRAFVIKMGEGLALPLPKQLAEAMNLGVGDCVEISGPDESGALRYAPTARSEDAPRVVRVPVRAVAATDGDEPPTDLPTPGEVAQAVSGGAPASAPAPAPAPVPAPVPESEPDEFDQEVDRLLEKHDAALRETLA
jgi:antitoxin component of MazEF toxin-antitoxin module